jgi:asparagine synthase (glutamine-hydrolysing)
MCGILGVFSPINLDIQQEKLFAGAQAMFHRGPDSQNTWRDKKNQIGFAHARLAIIGLDSGAQPMKSETSECVAVVNGEFYDYKNIRLQLQKEGARFQTESDSEILLHLWEKYGAECVHHLRGEFSFLLWDARKEVLFVGRDRFGIKPLYFAHHSGDWKFASEVKALKELGVPIAFDNLSLMMSATYGLCDSRTLFDGIEQVPAGHIMTISKGHFSMKKYWDFNYPKQGTTSSIPFPEAVKSLRSLLKESVSLRLEADVPVSIYLSGGLDSSVLAGIAAEVSQYSPKCYSVSFSGQGYDEAEFAMETAKKFNLPIDILKVSDSDLADNFLEAIVRCESIIENPAPIAKFLLSRRVNQDGNRIVLTGEGSDEIFGGYPHFRQDMYLHNRQGQDPKDLEFFESILSKSNSNLSGGLLGDFQSQGQKDFEVQLGFTPMIFKTITSSIDNLLVGFGNSSEVKQKKSHLAQIFLSAFDINGQLLDRDPMNISMYLWSKSFLNNRLLRAYGDGMEMSHSVEGRVPFLDHKLVDFVTTLPIHYKTKGVTDKYILREAAKPYITDTIFNREKHPFSAPQTQNGNQGRLSQLLKDTLISSTISKIDLLDKNACRGIADYISNPLNPYNSGLEMIALRIVSLCTLYEGIIQSK